MSVTDVFPLIKAPEAWPVPVVATLAMVLLAGLDLAAPSSPRSGPTTAASGRSCSARRLPRALLGVRVVAEVRRARPRDDGLGRHAPGRARAHRPLALRGGAAHRQVGRHRGRARRAGVPRARAERRAAQRRRGPAARLRTTDRGAPGRRRCHLPSCSSVPAAVPRPPPDRRAPPKEVHASTSRPPHRGGGPGDGRARAGLGCRVHGQHGDAGPDADARPRARRRTAAPTTAVAAARRRARSSTTRRSTRPGSSTAAGRC